MAFVKYQSSEKIQAVKKDDLVKIAGQKPKLAENDKTK